MLLAGDIGGTKTALALYSAESVLRAPVAEATFSSGDYPNLEAIVLEFLEQARAAHGASLGVDSACFGVAGPVVQAFQRKGRLSAVLTAMPIRVILDTKAGLRGAAQYGLNAIVV